MKRGTGLIIVLSALLAVTVTAALTLFFSDYGRKEYVYGQFIAPENDASAIDGTPDLTDVSGYTRFCKNEVPYSFCMLRKPYFTEDGIRILFTNEAENSVWLKIRIYDDSNNMIGETGIIMPGQYVETVNLSSIPTVMNELTVKIMAYEPYTYYSAGTISMDVKTGG